MRNNGEIKVGAFVRAFIPDDDEPNPAGTLCTDGVVTAIVPVATSGGVWNKFEVMRHDIDVTMLVDDGWITEYDNEGEA